MKYFLITYALFATFSLESQAAGDSCSQVLGTLRKRFVETPKSSSEIPQAFRPVRDSLIAAKNFSQSAAGSKISANALGGGGSGQSGLMKEAEKNYEMGTNEANQKFCESLSSAKKEANDLLEKFRSLRCQQDQSKIIGKYFSPFIAEAKNRCKKTAEVAGSIATEPSTISSATTDTATVTSIQTNVTTQTQTVATTQTRTVTATSFNAITRTQTVATTQTRTVTATSTNEGQPAVSIDKPKKLRR